MIRFLLIALACVAALSGCSDGDDSAQSTAPTSTAQQEGQRFPDVLSAVATQSGEDTWDFNVTVSSPYDSPERYADAWRVVAPDGTVLGERILAHPHADEQPFTRSLAGVEIPAEITKVTIDARDSLNGYGDGSSVEVGLSPRRE